MILDKIHLYRDSKSVLDKLITMDEFPTALLKTVMDSKWNVLQALPSLLEKLNTMSKLEWVAATKIMTQ